MRDLAFALANHLAPAADVTVARDEQTMLEVVADSDDWRADLHLCLHSNANPKGGNGVGAEAFYCPGSVKGEQMAQALYAAIAEMNPHGGRRCVPYRYTELTKTRAPAVYLEVGFHDNPVEAAWIMEKVDEIAARLAKVILEEGGLLIG